MIIGLVSDFCLIVNQRKYLVYLHVYTRLFDVKVVSIFLGFIFADSKSGKILPPNDLIKFGLLS